MAISSRCGVRAVRRRVGALALVFAVALAGAHTARAAEEALTPHRAIYDLSLRHAEPSTSLIAATGRLVFALGGSACEGYTVDFRNVTSVTDREGTRRVTDLRSSTVETLSPAALTFAHDTFVDDERSSGVKGKATARADGIAVEISAPKETELQLGRAVFPTAHTRLILDAAQAGERILEATVYDGGDEADSLYETATVIGPPQTGLPGASPAARKALAAMPDAAERTAWRLVISYFQPGGAEGERVPEYELTFTMLDNGVSYDVVFNYGAFALAGDLTELMVSEAPACADE